MSAQISPGHPSWTATRPSGDQHRVDTEIRMVSPRSALPVQGRYILMAAGVAAALLSLRFVLIGAWPVLIFAVLDIGVLAAAFHVFARRRAPEERLTLTNGQLVLTRIDHRGLASRLTLPAFWTRLEATGRSEVDCDLWLVFRGKRHPIGRCVAAAERKALMPRIEALLERARHP